MIWQLQWLLIAILLSSTASISAAGSTGLIGEYWNTTAVGTGKSSATCTQIDAEIDFQWTSSSAAAVGSLICGNISQSYFSARWTGQLQAPTSDEYNFTILTNGGVRLWIDDHLLIDQWGMPSQSQSLYASRKKPPQSRMEYSRRRRIDPNIEDRSHLFVGAHETPNGGNDAPSLLIPVWTFPLVQGRNYTIRLEYFAAVTGKRVISVFDPHSVGARGFENAAPSAALTLQLFWQTPSMASSMIVPSSAFIPVVNPSEIQRTQMRVEQSRGWNTWWNPSMTAHLKAEEGFGIKFSLYRASTQEYLSNIQVFRQNSPATVRAEGHMYDGSYTSLHIEWQDLASQVETAANSSSADTFQDQFYARFSATVRKTGNMSDYFLIIVPSMFWGRSGDIQIMSTGKDDASIIAQCPGLSTIYLYFQGHKVDHPDFHIPEPYIAFAVDAAVSVSTIQMSQLEISQQISIGRLGWSTNQAKYAPYVDLYDAMQSVMAWNTIYEPREGVVATVSRGWDFHAGYVLFDWDTYFCSLMASIDNKYLAYSSFIQITKAKTIQGFIPNYVSGTVASRDRTEPMVGARVLLSLYHKYQDDWLVDLVLQDLLDWADWVWNRRLQAPYNLIVLGSDPNLPIQSDEVNALQGARWESGLDNSPIYDDVVFDNVSHHMLLYDVGMTSFYLSELDALKQLSKIALERCMETFCAQMDILKETLFQVQDRFDIVATATQKFLWDETDGIYKNRRVDTDVFLPQLAPTSLLPMMSGIASVTQAETMIQRHLTNVSVFCVNVSCPGYGVPSISRQDPTYRDQDYWRGRVWGPHNLLVYLGLSHSAYNGSQVVTSARKQLCDQAAELLLLEWKLNHHIHENYNGDSGLGCDGGSSDPFYHWGALNGYITLANEGIA